MDIRVTLDGDGGVTDIAPETVSERSGPVAAKVNANHTPPRSIRVPDEIWEAMQAAAAEQGTSVSAETNRFYAQFIKNHLRNKELGVTETPLERTLRRLGA